MSDVAPSEAFIVFVFMLIKPLALFRNSVGSWIYEDPFIGLYLTMFK